MSGLLKWLRNEIAEVLPSVLFFFVVFNLMRWIESLFLQDSGIRLGSFVNASIGALIVGKVLLVVDLFPVVNAFQDKPLVYNTLWKTFLYSLAALLFRVEEELVPLAVEAKSLAGGFGQYLAEVHWPRFWAISGVCRYDAARLRRLAGIHRLGWGRSDAPDVLRAVNRSESRL